MELTELIQQPGYELKFGITELFLDTPKKCSAYEALDLYENELANDAALLGYLGCSIRYPGMPEGLRLRIPVCQRNFPRDDVENVESREATMPQVVTANVFTAPEIICWNQTLIGLLKRMYESDRPMYLIRLSDNRQIWINQLGADTMRSKGDEAVLRRISDFWYPEDLENLRHKLRDESDDYSSTIVKPKKFKIVYKAALNKPCNEPDALWGLLEGENEVIQIGSQWYRISIGSKAGCELIPNPMKVA